MYETKVYADITFLINFAMDFVIFWATAKLTGIQVVYKRLLAASFLGSLYAVAYLFQNMSFWFSLPVKVIFSALLVVVALWPQGWREFKKVFLCFYGICFIVAGATIAASYLFHTNSQSFSFSYSWLLAGVLCALLIGAYGDKYLKGRLPNLLRYNVRLRFNDLVCTGQGFLDTGNGLRDPVTRRPVIIAEYGLLKTCLPVDFQSAMENYEDENEKLDALCATSWANRLRLIPFSSIGKKNGLLIGLRCDEIQVDKGKVSLQHKDLVVGIYTDKLSSDNHYQMLIPSEVLQKV